MACYGGIEKILAGLTKSTDRPSFGCLGHYTGRGGRVNIESAIVLNMSLVSCQGQLHHRINGSPLSIV